MSTFEHFFVVRNAASIGKLAERLAEKGDASLFEDLKKIPMSAWPLSKEGVEQAKKMGDYFRFLQERGILIDQMYISESVRVKQTAIYSGLTDVVKSIDSSIGDRYWGDLKHKNRNHRHIRFSGALREGADPLSWGISEGIEPFKDILRDVRSFIDNVKQSNKKGVVVICSEDVMKAFRFVFCRLTPSEYVEMELSDDTTSRIDYCQIDHYTSVIDDQKNSKSDYMERFRICNIEERQYPVSDWVNIFKRTYSDDSLEKSVQDTISGFSVLQKYV